MASLIDDAGVTRFDGTITGAGNSVASVAIVTLSVAAPVASTAVVPFAVVTTDADGYWDAVTHLFTIPAGLGGVFYVECGILGDNAVTATGGYATIENTGPDPNLRAPLVNVNGGDWLAAGGSTIRLADGDTVGVTLTLFTAATMDVDAGSHFSIARLGDAP